MFRFDLLAQVEEMDILSGCVGCQLEAGHSGSEGSPCIRELCLRIGPLFRLQLQLPASGTNKYCARLELVNTGANT